MSDLEPNAPGSSEMKTKATEGTQGRFSGVAEYQLNLDISLMLREALEEQGYQVILTREDNDTAISNAERAQMANDAGADIAVRIHANGSEDSSTNGALALIGSQTNPYVGALYDDSYHLAQCILENYCSSTGMRNQGIQTNDTMTGINWSRIPVMILEMGFMSNEQDDRNMQDDTYRQKMIEGIVNGITAYYDLADTKKDSSSKQDGQTDSEELTGLRESIESVIAQYGLDDGNVAVYVRSLNNGNDVDIASHSMQSASLIKLYVAGCVYKNYDNVIRVEKYDGEINELVRKMITVSDNDATNELIHKLGNGDAALGMTTVNQFCQEYHFDDTSMGRLMLDFDSVTDNYTSVKDCTDILDKIYNGDLPGASSILEYLKQQERTEKIPAGIPTGITVANKTGELPDVENDAAIIYLDQIHYILCVMTEKQADTSRSRQMIVDLSKTVYEEMK